MNNQLENRFLNDYKYDSGKAEFTKLKMLLLQLAVGFFVGSLAASDVLITSPHSVVKWQAGKTAKITWKSLVDEIKGGKPGQVVNVDLMDGDDKDAKVIARVAKNIPIENRSVSWTVPENFPSTKTVFVRVASPDGKISRYSHRFGIQGDANYRWGNDWNLPQEPVSGPSVTGYSAISSSLSNEASLTTETPAVTPKTSSIQIPYKSSTTANLETETSTSANSTEDYDTSTTTSLRVMANNSQKALPAKILLLCCLILFCGLI